jgi:hypothetical protein
MLAAALQQLPRLPLQQQQQQQQLPPHRLSSLSCNEAISFVEVANLAFHVCLEVDVSEDVVVVHTCVEKCICKSDCNCCYVRVGGPPVGTKDNEGCDAEY